MSKIVQSKTIQFSKSTQFKCKYSLIVKNIYFKLFSLVKQYRFCLHTVTCQNSSKLNNLVWCEYSFNVKKQFYLK